MFPDFGWIIIYERRSDPLFMNLEVIQLKLINKI